MVGYVRVAAVGRGKIVTVGVRTHGRGHLCAALCLVAVTLAGCSGSLAGPPPSPRATVRYVSPTGSDANDGTVERPFRTIGAAAAGLEPGDTLRIRGGTYAERVTFEASGTAANPITIEPEGVDRVTIARGFRVTGSHLVVRNLVVSPGESNAASLTAERSKYTRQPWTTGQVQITGDNNILEGISIFDEDRITPTDVPGLAITGGSNNLVRDLDLHDAGGVCVSGAESGEPRGSTEGNTISGGTVHHTRGMLFNISADRTTVEYVKMHDPGQVGSDGNASDGINLAGAHITIRGCRIFNILRRYQSQHSDAIQWWNKADDLLIEGNVFGSYKRYRTPEGPVYFDEGHIQWSTLDRNSITGEDNVSSQRVVIRNNVFINAGEYYAINAAPQHIKPGSANGWIIANNTFRSPQGIRPDMCQKAKKWVIVGNVFCSDGPDHRGADWIIDYNAYTGRRSPQDGPHSLQYIDPRFVDNDVSRRSRFGRSGDWSLRGDSPLIDRGDPKRSPKTDFDGHTRGRRPDIGAFEYAPD